MFHNLDFTPYILEVFRFYFLKFWSIWILHPKVSEFRGVKSKQPETLWGKIQVLKRQDIKSKYPKIQKVKSKF